MFFLFRCLFWLGVVFSQIAGHEGLNALGLAGQPVQLAGESVSGLGKAALGAAGRSCRADPEKCLAVAAQAARLSQAASPSRDTLNAGDRAPAWRLRADAAGRG